VVFYSQNTCYALYFISSNTFLLENPLGERETDNERKKMIFTEKRERASPVALVVLLVAGQPRSGDRELFFFFFFFDEFIQ
jgi:hypothetical protein